MDKLFSIWGREPKNSIKVESEFKSELFPPRLLDKHPELIDRDKLRVFQNWANKKGEGGLFGKLVDNLRYIDQQDLTIGLSWMKDEIQNFVGDDDYLVAIHRRGHSGEWIYKQLELRPPVGIIAGFDIENEGLLRNKKYKKIIYPDDGNYSGSQTVAVFKDAIKHKVVNPKTLGLFYIGTTHIAENTINSYLNPNTIKSRYNIPTVSEIFDENEKQRLQKLFNGWAGHYDQAILTFLWSRIPDNFFGGLKSSIGQTLDAKDGPVTPNHFLFNDWRSGPFKPPYRNQKDF